MKMEYILQGSFDTSDGKLIIDLPTRYYDYYMGNDLVTDGSDSLIDSGSHESMVDSSLMTLYMKWDDSGNTYQFWPASLEHLEGQKTFGDSE